MSEENKNMFKVRVSAVVVCGDEMALIYRTTPQGDSWTLPGGNVSLNEDIVSAIQRELNEELGISNASCELMFLQDMLIHRSDRQDLYRKLHIIFRVIIPTKTKKNVKSQEHDDLSLGEIRWVKHSKLAHLHIYPNIGKMLAELRSLDEKISQKILNPMTDENFSWR